MFPLGAVIAGCGFIMAFALMFETALALPDEPLIAIGTVLISGLVATALTLALWEE